MSAPKSMGLQRIGVAKVLSIIRGTPWAWAISGKFLNIQHRQGRIGQRLAEYRLGVGLKGFGDGFLIRASASTKIHSIPSFFSGDGKQVDGPPVNRARC